MDVFYEKLSRESEYSINCFKTVTPYFDVPWHFHSETEILYIEKSNGLRFVGDHSESFETGDIGLIGSNLPHVWKSDSIYRKNNPELSAVAIVVHFHEAIFSGPFSALPEIKSINQLLFDSHSGIKFTGAARASIAAQMKEIVVANGIDKLLRLIKILDVMSLTDEKQLLASSGYSKIRKSFDFDRYDKAQRFMIDNFQRNISLKEISDIIGMTPTSFCRYFKKHSNKSFHTILNEIRIGHACKLLLENKMNISGICFESGFNNVSNFNEQFKKIKGVSPSNYVKNRQRTI
jgi:AraC-like DNA-binding protein